MTGSTELEELVKEMLAQPPALVTKVDIINYLAELQELITKHTNLARIEKLETFQTQLALIAMAKKQSKSLEQLYDLITNELKALSQEGK